MKIARLICYAVALVCLLVSGWGVFTEQNLFGRPYWRVAPTFNLVGSAAILAASFFHSRIRRRAGIVDPAPSADPKAWARANGVWVLVLTALLSLAVGLGLGTSPQTQFWALLAALILFAGAFALARFVARYGDEIGEARFVTRNPDERIR